MHHEGQLRIIYQTEKGLKMYITLKKNPVKINLTPSFYPGGLPPQHQSKAIPLPLSPLCVHSLLLWADGCPVYLQQHQRLSACWCVPVCRLFTDRLPGQPTPCTCVVSAYLESSERLTKQLEPPCLLHVIV